MKVATSCLNLICFVTGVSSQIPWNPDSDVLTFITNGEDGEKSWLSLKFYDENMKNVGHISLSYKELTGTCVISNCNSFNIQVPTATQKIWTIKYEHAAKKIALTCNGVELGNVAFSDWCIYNEDRWMKDWGIKPTQIWFWSSDNFSLKVNVIG